MATRGEWDEIVAKLRNAASPDRDPAFAQFYRLALEDANLVLRSFDRIPPDQREDLVHDILVLKLPRLLAADNPRAYFVTAVANRAKDWLRNLKASGVVYRIGKGDDDEVTPPFPEQNHPPRAEAVLELRDTLEHLGDLSPRDVQVFEAVVFFNEKRKTIAAICGMTRENVDQIVSRVRRRLRERSE